MKSIRPEVEKSIDRFVKDLATILVSHVERSVTRGLRERGLIGTKRARNAVVTERRSEKRSDKTVRRSRTSSGASSRGPEQLKLF